MKSSPDEVSLCAIEDDYFHPGKMSWRWPKIISSLYLTQYFGYEFLSKNKRKVGIKYIGLYDCMKHSLYEQNAKLILVWKMRWKSLDWLWCCELNPGLDTCQAWTLSLSCFSSPENVFFCFFFNKTNILGHVAFQQLRLHVYFEALTRTKWREFTEHNQVLFKFSRCIKKRKHRLMWCGHYSHPNLQTIANHNCLVHRWHDCYLLLLVWGTEEYHMYSLV